MDLGTIDNDHVLAFLKEKCTAAVIPFLVRILDMNHKKLIAPASLGIYCLQVFR